MHNKLKFIQNFYLSNNLKIFPIMENKKTPLINAWQRECSNDFLQILYWLEDAKNCNFGLPANENNLFIIDIDMHNGINGYESFNKLLSDLNIEQDNVLSTLSQSTPSGGMHFIFKSDDELKKVVNSANCFDGYPGIDIRTNGYILVEPSVIDEKEYKFTGGYEDIIEMPKELRTFILENNNKEITERKTSGYIKPEKVERGGRDIAVFEYVNQLYYKTRLDYNEVLLLVHYFNSERCVPPLPDGVIEYKVRNVFKKPRDKIIYVNLGSGDDSDVY